MTHKVRNITAGPIALDGGRVLEPGEDADIDPGSDHDTALEDDGRLLRLAPGQQKPKNKDKDKEGES